MRRFRVLVLPLADGFRALVDGVPVDSYELAGFGTKIEAALARNTGGDIKVEYALSPELKPNFGECSRCHGANRVQADEQPAAQSMANDFSSIDFSRRGTALCSNCKGLGVEIPHFWRDDVVTA